MAKNPNSHGWHEESPSLLARKKVYWFIGDTRTVGAVDNHFPQREEKKNRVL